jgi:RNA polymerase sigma factor (sigma-70 family)
MDMEIGEYELAVQARDGDQEALAELVERLRIPLFALAYAELRHYEDAQDAVAAALLQICRHVKELREPERVRAWMHTIVRNEVRRLRRGRAPEACEVIPERMETRSTAGTPSGLRLDIERALRQLPRDQARALTLFYLSGLSVHDIARQTQRPPGTITRWLHQGRRQLAREMEEYAPMPPDLNSAVGGTDLDPMVIQRLTDALTDAGFTRVHTFTEIGTIGDLYRDEQHRDDWPFSREFHFSRALEDSRLILLDEWIAGRSAFELFSILKATPEGKNSAFGLLIRSPAREESTVFAAWASGFDLCFARVTDKGDLQPWFARVREGLEKSWGRERRRGVMAEMIKASSKQFWEVVEQVPDDTEADYKGEGASAGPIVRIAHTLIQQAIIDGASEIHVEPGEGYVAIQFRLPASSSPEHEGELRDIMKLPRHLHPKLIARYKYMADMNVEEHDVPQAGSIAISHNGKDFDLEVQTEITVNGEKVTISVQGKR